MSASALEASEACSRSSGRRPKTSVFLAASEMRPEGPRCLSIHSRTTGSAVSHMLSFGFSVRATPSTTTMVFCIISSCGWVAMS